MPRSGMPQRLSRILDWMAAGLCVLLLLSWAALASAEEPAADVSARPALSAEESVDVARIEEYLNGISTLSSEYYQINPDGSVAQGMFYLSRPGKLRFEYVPPSPLLVVGDGVWLHYYDRELGQVNDYPIDKTPIGVLARERIRFEPPLEIAGLARRPGVIDLVLVDGEDPGQGSLTLTFADRPIELKQWSITDPQGRITTIAFVELSTNVPLDEGLFVFDDPRAKIGPGRALRH